MKLLPFACAPLLAVLSVPAFASMEMASLSADLDGDTVPDTVKLVNDGQQYLRLTVQLSQSRQTLENSALLPANRTQGMWMDEPTYSLSPDDQGGFVMSASVHSAELRGDETRTFRFHTTFDNQSLELRTFTMRYVHRSSMQAKAEHVETDDFVNGTIEVRYRTFLLRNGEEEAQPWSTNTDALPFTCRAPFPELAKGLPMCAQQLAAFLWQERANPTRQSCSDYNGIYLCRENGQGFTDAYRLYASSAIFGNAKTYSFRRGPLSTFFITDQQAHRTDNEPHTYDMSTATCHRARLHATVDHYSDERVSNRQFELDSRRDIEVVQLDATGTVFSFTETYSTFAGGGVAPYTHRAVCTVVTEE